MKFSSIQVTPGLRRRLARYKDARMSYEDVITTFLDVIPVEEFRTRRRRALASVGEEIGATLRRDPAEAAADARRGESERLARLTPGARMEAAYHLHDLVRGRG